MANTPKRTALLVIIKKISPDLMVLIILFLYPTMHEVAQGIKTDGNFYMNLYFWLKIIHFCLIALSLSLFLSRAVMRLNAVNWTEKWPSLKIIPHINDTLLLGSGVLLAVYSSTPFLRGWLCIKLTLLIVYILVGSYTLKYAKTKQQQLIGIFAAFLTISAMIYVAIEKISF
jgi:uncharacterized membrane protein SirB2